MLLTDLLGRTVVSPDGTSLRIRDLGVDPDTGEVRFVLARRRRGSPQAYAWPGDGGGGDLLLPAPARVPGDQLLLRRDVLDAQMVDLAGRRLSRVADVVLEEPGARRAVAVEVGSAGVLRRLGLRRLADLARTRLVSWEDFHLTSAYGHGVMLETTLERLPERASREAAVLVSKLPPHRAAEVLRRVPRGLAEAVLATLPDRRHAERLRSLLAGRRPHGRTVARFLRHRPRRGAKT